MNPNDPGVMLLSGGTTGMPKGIPRTHNDYVFQWKQMAEAARMVEEWVSLPCVPIGHNASLNPIVGGSVLTGGTIATEPVLKTEALLERIVGEGADYFFAVPTQLVDILEGADEVRIRSGETTDVTMSIAGNPPLNDYGENNLPGGEVFTAPIPDSVEGEVLFDMPLYHQGREVTDVYLRFEDGDVVDHAAAKNEALLTEVLDTDEGASRLGELGIGMNRDVDRFTYNMLFDEKMGDTVHMAVGRAYEDTVGEDNERNESAVHVDMIVDMSEDSEIVVDGEQIQTDGTFVFEE